jgi:hypothetical protein
MEDKRWNDINKEKRGDLRKKKKKKRRSRQKIKQDKALSASE